MKPITIKKEIEIKDEEGFSKWFVKTFWDINGKYALPTKEELCEIASLSYKKLVK